MRVAQAWTDSYKGNEASLSWYVHQPGSVQIYNRTEQKNNDSCIRSIGYAINKNWMTSVSKTSLIGFDPAVKVDASTGTLSADVSAMVRAWLSGGRPNDGFVLIAHDPAPKEHSNTECLTHYEAAKLTLQYR